jgi:hypothetical protein
MVYLSEFLATDPEFRVLFPALPDFLISSRSGTGPLSLVRTTEELLGRNNSGFGLENREYGHRDTLRSLCDTPLSAKVGTYLTDNRESLGVVRSRARESAIIIIIIIIIIIVVVVIVVVF